jgi:hypothetical protein
MSLLTRRDAVLALATGSTALAAQPAAAREPAAPALETAAQAARDAAARFGVPCERPGPLRTVQAHVLLVRSWDRQVYLFADEGFRGFVALDETAFAVAAACQAAGRPAAVQAWGYAPAWGGVGRFDGARLALDARDFPAGSDGPPA